MTNVSTLQFALYANIGFGYNSYIIGHQYKQFGKVLADNPEVKTEMLIWSNGRDKPVGCMKVRFLLLDLCEICANISSAFSVSILE